MEHKQTKDILKETAHLPAEEQVARLFEIIDTEKDKPSGDIDYERVEACSRRIDELARGGLFELSDDRIRQIRIENTAKIKRSHKMVRNPVKIIAAIAAAVLLLGMLIIPAAGELSIIEVLHHAAKNLQKGESFQHGNMTVINNGDFFSCASLEELPEQYRWDAYYPISLHNGLSIDTIYVTNDLPAQGNCEIIFNFSDSTVFFTIQNYHHFDMTAYTDAPVYESAAGNFVIIKGCQAVCQSGTYEYCVKAQEEATLKAFIDGLGKLP